MDPTPFTSTDPFQHITSCCYQQQQRLQQQQRVKQEQQGGQLGVAVDHFSYSDVVRGYSIGKAVEIWGVPSLQCSAAEYDDLVRRQVIQREVAAVKEVRELLAANPDLRLESDRNESGKRRWLIVRRESMKVPRARDRDPRRLVIPS